MVVDKARYVFPGLTLGDVNDLIGWKARHRGGNWHWTDSGGLLVQVKLSTDIDEDPKIIAVYDSYHKVSKRWDAQKNVIVFGPWDPTRARR